MPLGWRPAEMTRIPTVWFEGPVIPQPASQQKEDYPVDSAARLSIAQDTPRGVRRLQVHNPQGTSHSLLFMVGDLPEVSEQETDGQPIPQLVSLPVTANGRIFPREDIDHWAFEARADITLTATPTAAFGRSLITLQGTAMVQEQPVTVLGTLQEQAAGEPSRNQISLAVNVPTPFKFAGSFESKFIPRGSVYVRHYSLERNGFEGAITVQLADRQTRHLQGITGPTVVVPAGQTEFDYPAKLPPWLDVGRTSRTCLMAIGEVDIGDGRTARVTYTSQAQNDQMIVLTAPEEFSLDTAISSVRAIPSTTVDIPITIGRARHLTQAVKVEVDVPQHISGVTAEPVQLTEEANSAVLRLAFAEQSLGPFNMPLTIRASTTDPRGHLVTAECPLEIVPAK